MEIWDLYSKEGVFLDKTIQRGMVLPKDTYHLVVHIIIVNTKGEFLIQKRSETKDLWPGQWAFTGGSALTGESSEEAALRELSEETGIELSKGDLQYLSRLHYGDYFSDLYLGLVDVDASTLKFQVEEVSELAYVGRDRIIEMQNEEIFHYYREDFMNIVLNI
jgi:8-oxo-dGTP pyrophosphatase MutT (NUDIX family)